MHRERKREIVKFSIVGICVLLWVYITFPWYIVVLFLAVILAAFLMLPPDEMYIERDEILAKKERLDKLEGVQTTLSQYKFEGDECDTEKEKEE